MGELEALGSLLSGRKIALLSGAGCSTESGIPDYRGPGTRERARNPIQYKGFVGSAQTRRRYWARAVVGWRRFAGAQPNAAHQALADLERLGAAVGLITQNVDGLHQEAGSQRVVELHGTLSQVRCLECKRVEDRESVQARLAELNPGFGEHAAALAPDGDADLPDELIEGFQVVACRHCGGPLKPNVVFFGESVPAQTVAAAYDIVHESDALLVVGSSLAVFSGYRFVRHAAERELPIGIVNLGETRGDPYATLKVEAKLGEFLPQLASALRGAGTTRT